MRPGVQVLRAILCANGQVHYGHEHFGGKNLPETMVGIANEWSNEPWCGGAPHYEARQTVTTSEWHKVRP